MVTHCLNSSTLLGSEEKKQKTTRTTFLQSRKWREFMKSHLFSNCRRRGIKTILPEVYKLTSPNPNNKNKVEIHKDRGLYGIEFTVDKTIAEFNKGADKVELSYASSFIEFENVLEGALNSAWKHVLKEHFPEPIDPQRAIYCRSPIKTLRKVSRELSSSSFSVVRMRRSSEIAS